MTRLLQSTVGRCLLGLIHLIGRALSALLGFTSSDETARSLLRRSLSLRILTRFSMRDIVSTKISLLTGSRLLLCLRGMLQSILLLIEVVVCISLLLRRIVRRVVVWRRRKGRILGLGLLLILRLLPLVAFKWALSSRSLLTERVVWLLRK